jgi:hypothetical protein
MLWPSIPLLAASVASATRDDPCGLQAGRLCDQVKILVVMQHGRIMDYGRGCDEEIRDGSPVLADRSEVALDASRKRANVIRRIKPHE